MFDLKIDLGNLTKLLNKGRIDKVYDKMYYVADKRAREETQTFLLELQAKVNEIKDPLHLITMISDFKKERISFHMNEMKQLLEISVKNQSNKE